MDLSKLNIFGKIYNFKDTEARSKGEENAKSVGVLQKTVDSLKGKINSLKTISVSPTTPIDENTELWINPDATEGFPIPEINDDVTNTSDTWSSKKINNELQLLSNENNKKLESKVSIIEGKSLSTNDYTNEEKEKLKSLRNYDDTEIKKEIATKVGYSEVVGNQLLMYADNTKEKLLATLELPSGVEDVQIDGTSIVENGIAEIPLCTDTKGPGLIAIDIYSNSGGLYRANNDTGLIRIAKASDNNLAERKNEFCPVVPKNLDYAVKAAMCDGKGAAWTEEEQASARERIGIPTDWQLVDDITIEKAVVKIAIDTDYSQYNEIMIQTMLQPTENNVLVKVISSNNPNTVDPWQSNIALLEAPKTTDKTVYSITILERNNLGIFVKKQLASANNHSVSANLIPTVAYYYTQAVPRDINGNKISANVIADDFEIICSQPQTSFKYLTIGSYKEAIAPGSKFKIYAR